MFKHILYFSLAFIAINESVKEVNSLNILGLFPYQGKSHFFVFQPFLRELASRGHSVTVVSYFPQKENVKNYTDITLSMEGKAMEETVKVDHTLYEFFEIFMRIIDNANYNCKDLLANEQVQGLLESKPKFDVVIVEQFTSDCALVIPYKLGAPVVATTSHMLLPYHFDRFGVPTQFFEFFSTPDFFQRILITSMIETFKIFAKYYTQRADEITIAEYFEDVPPLEELGRGVQLVLVYNHFVLTGPKALPENVKEVGGYHVQKAQPLPETLRKFIEDSKHGVIYVSFGSMVKSSTLPLDKLNAIIGALRKLPQRVVWKWEAESLPGNPENIYLSKWLPQNDILAHPNVVAFYSHCGLLGTTESIHHGVPIICMPVFADQPINAIHVVEAGFGVKIQYADLTTDLLLENLRTVLEPEFRRKVKQLSTRWHDRPLSPMDTAIYWTEYVARLGNYSIRIPAVQMPRYKLLLWDILLAGVCTVVAMLYVLKWLLFRKRNDASVKQKKA